MWPPVSELVCLFPNFEQWIPTHPLDHFQGSTSLSESFSLLKTHMWDRASFSQTVFSIFCVSVAVFPSFKQNLMFIWCCILTKKNKFTHLALTYELTELGCSFHWSMVFITWTTKTSYSWLMYTKAYLHKSISLRTLLCYFVYNPYSTGCTVQIMKLIFDILETKYSQHFYSVAFTF